MNSLYYLLLIRCTVWAKTEDFRCSLTSSSIHIQTVWFWFFRATVHKLISVSCTIWNWSIQPNVPKWEYNQWITFILDALASFSYRWAINSLTEMITYLNIRTGGLDRMEIFQGIWELSQWANKGPAWVSLLSSLNTNRWTPVNVSLDTTLSAFKFRSSL